MDKIIDIEERIPTLRERRRKRTNIKFFVLLLLFFIILFLLLYFQSSYSDIKEISINGEGLVEEELYLKNTGLQIGDPMWSFRSKEIEQKILQQHWVKEVEVKRNWLNKVVINIDEYRKVAFVSIDNELYPMLENGDIFKEASMLEPIDAPLFIDFEEDKIRKKLLAELGQLEENVLALISQINYTPTSADPYAITLYMNDGYEVRAEITSVADKLNYYPSIISQIESTGEFEKGVIDIEVGSYYRSFEDEYSPVINNEDRKAEQEVTTNEETTSQ